MVAREHINIISNNKKKKYLSEYIQTEPIIKKFDVIKKEKQVITIFIKSEYKNIEKKIENKENIQKENIIINNINKEPKNNSIININITNNNNLLNKSKNNNILLIIYFQKIINNII